MKNYNHIVSIGTIVLTSLFCLTSCSVDVDIDDDVVVIIDADFEDLESWTPIRSLSENQVRNMVAQNEPELNALISTRALSSVDVYKITYNTVNVEEENIVASGLVMIPENGTNLPLLSFQHGTIFTNADAPSNYNTEKLATVFGTILAASNYAVIMPDYLGYGASSNYPHPYEHQKTLGSVSYDMIKAVKEGLSFVDNLILNDKLFLTGYSESGYATMALHKHIEENTNIPVTMSAPASGAYNKSAFFKAMMQLDDDFLYPGSPMWVIDAYNWVYNLDHNWNSYINEPYASTMENISNPFDYINANIATNPQDLYTSEFRAGLVNETDAEYLNIVADNDIFDWTPTYPITLYYASEDDWVFPLNSETAYEHLSANGANINSVIYQGEDHFSARILYVQDVYELFETLR
jgi:pimeloyl-ACP methyl ester carboxylesterase